MTKRLNSRLWLSLFFGSSLLAAVFFQGFFTEFFCISLALLIFWAGWVVWRGYEEGLKLPLTPFAVVSLLYWIWLVVSGIWGRVELQGTIAIWWLGALPLVFWIYTLSPGRDEIWRHGYRWAVMIGVGLAVAASCQWLIYGLEPNATFLNRQSLAALLNLILIPLTGYFLILGPLKRRWLFLLGGVIFVLAFALALIEGRGATIAGAIAFLFLLGVAVLHMPKRRIVALVGIIAVAFAIGATLGRVGVGQRLEGVAANPWEAGSTRLVIWKQSWKMLQDSPWMGIGVGHYSLYWPPYRDPSDTSDGFFVHNDYLQFWIEAGLPGLILLLALLVAAAFMYVRAMRMTTDAPTRVEATALLAGLAAVAMHSFLDFNLYVLSILLLAGLTLGRLHSLAYANSYPRFVLFAPSKVVSRPGYRLLVGIVAAFPLLYFSTLGLASSEYQRGLKLVEESQWGQGYAVLHRATRLYPYADNVMLSTADLLRHLITLLPESADAGKKQEFFDEAERLLVRAEELNPFRPQTFAVHAFFYEQNSTLVGADWVNKVANYYRRAVELEPRGYQERYLYARFLLSQGRQEEARRILEDGMKYELGDSERLIPFYAFTAQLRSQNGDRRGATELMERINSIREARLRERAYTPTRPVIGSP